MLVCVAFDCLVAFVCLCVSLLCVGMFVFGSYVHSCVRVCLCAFVYLVG